MKKLTCSAIALTMTCAAGFASDGEWSALDQEVGALASTLSLDGGATVSGSLRTGYATSGDISVMADLDGDGFFETTLGDLGGFAVDQARIAVEGSNGDYGYRIDYDFAATGGLRDAYATFGIAESVSAQMGQFRMSTCSDADKDENEMDHFYHSAIGGAYAGFTGGLGLSGDASGISWALSIMNGVDSVADELATALRVSMTVMDGGEGGMSVNAGVAIVDEGDVDGLDADLGGTIIEVSAGDGTWGVGIETMDVADDGAGVFSSDYNIAGLGFSSAMLTGDTSPMVISASYAATDTWTGAIRMTDYDLASNAELMEVTATNHIADGVSWQIGIQEISADGMDDVSATQVGLRISF
jgi:hypothetical protein